MLSLKEVNETPVFHVMEWHDNCLSYRWRWPGIKCKWKARD